MGTKYYIYLLTWTSYSCFRYYVTVKWQFLKLQLQRYDCQQSNHQICFKLWSIHFTIFYHKLVFGIEKNSNTTAMKVNIFLYIQNSLSKKGKYSLNMASPSILLKIKLASVSKLWNLLLNMKYSFLYGRKFIFPQEWKDLKQGSKGNKEIEIG